MCLGVQYKHSNTSFLVNEILQRKTDCTLRKSTEFVYQNYNRHANWLYVVKKKKKCQMQIGDEQILYFCLAEFNKKSPVKHIPKESHVIILEQG